MTSRFPYFDHQEFDWRDRAETRTTPKRWHKLRFAAMVLWHPLHAERDGIDRMPRGLDVRTSRRYWTVGALIPEQRRRMA